MKEQTFLIDCRGDAMPAILSLPDGRPASVGVVVVVGGPQTRVGSHRQFVLLARALAKAGFACLRFDYRGMGDAAGTQRDFEGVSDDIAAAIADFKGRVPSVERVVLWGLCDGATAASFFAESCSDVCGLVLLNPWVRTQSGEAAALVKSYYGGRLFSADFWGKLISGRVDIRTRLSDFARNLRAARCARPGDPIDMSNAQLPERVGASLLRFHGPVLLGLSGNDLTAAEFELAARDGKLAEGLAACRVTWLKLSDANHTFSSRKWRTAVEESTVAWLNSDIAG
ncbi:hydrolase 1, exosortase A system-associated [Niveibacterium sp. 24ML]|uniref:hydrolase 1, exosortase A system-associated n=1 Tax=Niveibacterium sp. 24ML TaxID=2985512 RepID=UPI00226FD986|nr:hydrolase 1, exosortase A system-associated [Niveibacterium sp. 24ML]MCX9156857.1 hydrolase 1, exosortase A system-associated [Niveibacterium sp. 24ML]